MKETKIISAFPATGKTYLYKTVKNLIILDSDSSKFSWISEGIRNPEFPANYIRHIKENMGMADIIFVSTHKTVRDALVANEIAFILVYPLRNLKWEYMSRCYDRGDKESFIAMLVLNWYDFLDELEAQEGCQHIILKKGEFLSDRRNEWES